MSGWTKNGRLSVYMIYMYLYKKIIKYKKKEKLLWKMALPPDELVTSKDATVLIYMYTGDRWRCVGARFAFVGLP